MNIPSDLKYTKTHEWIKLEANGTALIGITDHAQDLLGDIVFVELPTIGKRITAGDECGVIESVKAAADIYAPISGEVVAINDQLSGAPETINKNAYGAWIFKVKPTNSGELTALLNATDYKKTVDSETH